MVHGNLEKGHYGIEWSLFSASPVNGGLDISATSWCDSGVLDDWTAGTTDKAASRTTLTHTRIRLHILTVLFAHMQLNFLYLWHFSRGIVELAKTVCAHNMSAMTICTHDLASYPGLLAFVACSTNVGEGLVKLSHVHWHTGMCGGVAHSWKSHK